MGTKASAEFEEAILAVVGLQSGEKPNSLLSSLPSELCFNQLRDASRRHSKQERCSAPALHAVAVKASHKHRFGCEGLQLEDADWSTHITRSQIKVSVHSSLRSTDKELGISAEGLTKHRSCKNYTKPHVWTYRLELLDVLSKLYQETPGGEEEKRVMVINCHADMWVAKVIPELCFLREKGSEDFPLKTMITTRSGPFTVGCAKFTRGDGDSTAYVPEQDSPYMRVVATDIFKYEVALAKPLGHEESGKLQWQINGEWMTICQHIADFGILNLSATLLANVCNRLKLKGKCLDHLHRAELFLRHMNCSEEWIQSVLEQLKAKQRKKKEAKEKVCEDKERGLR